MFSCTNDRHVSTLQQVKPCWEFQDKLLHLVTFQDIWEACAYMPSKVVVFLPATFCHLLHQTRTADIIL